MKKGSPVIDRTTSLTMSDICRTLKGTLREQDVGVVLYCLAALERAQCFAVARRLIVAALFETGAALDFARVLPIFADGVADNDYAALRTQAKLLCSRGDNFYHMVPDMLARVTGLNDENTLCESENISYPRVMVLINAVRQHFAERVEPDAGTLSEPAPAVERGFFIQTAFALISNLHANFAFDHRTIWRVTRLQRMLVLGGYDAALWRLYAMLPDVYAHWNNDETRTFLRCIAALAPLLASSDDRAWDKRRLAHVTIAAGLLFPFNVDAQLSGGAAESPALQLPLPLPPWFYATHAAPAASAAVITRAARPTSVDRYVALRYGKMAATWDPMRAELLTLMAAAGGMACVRHGSDDERPCCSMAVQSAKFRPRLAHARVITPAALKDRPVALCTHVFFTESAVNSSSICAANKSFIVANLAPPHLAVLYPSSMLQPNSEFMRACEAHLAAQAIERRGLRLLVGGPFVDVEHIARVVAYRAMWRAVGLYDGDAARFEPFLLLQPADRTLVSIMLHTAWVPTPVDGNEARCFVWAMEWAVRYVLRMDSAYRACDFASSDAGQPDAFFTCLAAYYPSCAWSDATAAEHEAACVARLGAAGCTAELVDGAIDILTEALAAPSDGTISAFEAAVSAGPPSLATVYRSMVIQSAPHYVAQVAALRAALKIARATPTSAVRTNQ